MPLSDSIVVLGEGSGFHRGFTPDDYAGALRDRLPNHDIYISRTLQQARELSKNARVMTGSMINEEIIANASQLRLFSVISSGYDHLPLNELERNNVAVTNASGVHAPSVSEHALSFMLTFSRYLHEGFRRKQQRVWQHYLPLGLDGSTVTVVGQGSIGQAVIRRLNGFDIDTISIRHSPSKGGPADEVYGYDREHLHHALAQTDYLVLTCPLTDKTQNLISSDELAILPADAVLINVARGGVVEMDALTSAIQGERLRGAALDVTEPEPLPADHPLWSFENVLITPHIAGYSPQNTQLIADIVAENVKKINKTESFDDLKNLVVNP